MNPIRVKTNKQVEQGLSLEELFGALPAKLHYGEQYGLQLQMNGNGTEWCARYWTNFPCAEHKQHPKVPTHIGQLKSVLAALWGYLGDKGLLPAEYQRSIGGTFP